MAVPETLQISASVEAIVRKAKADGTLGDLTPRVIRRQVEESLKLESGVLDAKEYRATVKNAVGLVLDEGGEEGEDRPVEKSEDKVPSKRISDAGDDVTRPSKKPKSVATSKPKKNQKPEATEKPVKARISEQKYKSAAVVPTSDMEEDVDGAEIDKIASSSSVAKSKTRLSTGSTKNVPQENKSAHGDPPRKKVSKKLSTANNEVKSSAVIDSDSEMSVVIDEPSKKKRKSKAKDAGSKPEKHRKEKRPAVELSKDEETIKRLKSYVVGCGMRKIWSKEFKDLDSSQQIKRLKEILADLGMTGRLSLEQAKAIKEKRELAQELEDVRSFERAVAGQSRNKSQPTSDPDEQSASDSSAENEDIVPMRRRNAARKSIMAFLDDQSDDE